MESVYVWTFNIVVLTIIHDREVRQIVKETDKELLEIDQQI